jgi:acetyl-CoA hydrolase
MPLAAPAVMLDDLAALDFSSIVRSGDTVVCGQGLAEPIALTAALVEQRNEIGRFTMFIGPSYAGTFKNEHGDAIAFRSYCGTGNNSALHAAGILDVVPVHYSALSRLFADGDLRADVVLLTASEPDENGQYNLGLASDHIIEAARRAREVVIEVSDRIPWVFGAELPVDVRPTHVVRTGREPPELTRKGVHAATEAERSIVRHVCSLVQDGATIEFGIGTLPELVLQGLRNHKDIGVHSGVIGDGVVDLMEAGVVNNTRKPIDTGVSVGGLLMGSRRLLDFANRNRSLTLRPASYTHDAKVLQAIPQFMALNSALQIDLTGQVNAEALDGRYIGAVCGQVDFTRGGSTSPGGVAVTMLASRTQRRKVSSIVKRLNDGVVTTPRSDVDMVVTEWGVARLRGKSLRERATELIAIAHPDFRDELSGTLS